MKSTDAPSKQAVPFGTNGPREAITATTPSGSNQASYDQGFPPITMTLKSAGGLPPKGQDMNQILFEQSSFNRYFAAGGGYVYDSTFSTAVGGYPVGAVIPNSTGNGVWINTIEDNQANPENSTAALTGWVPGFSAGSTSISGLSSSSVTLTTLQASKDRIILSGNLTANINIIVPAWVKKWDVTNNCVGSFSVTIKTASGSGVATYPGNSYVVYGDGTNVTTNNQPQRSSTFTSAGSFIVPAGVYTIYVSACAGGGGGASGATNNGGQSSLVGGGGGGGGGAGQFIYKQPYSVTPGQVINITTGSAGPGAAGSTSGAGKFGGNGGSTVIGSLITLSPGLSGNPGIQVQQNVAGYGGAGGAGGGGYPSGQFGSDGNYTGNGGNGASSPFGGGGGGTRAATGTTDPGGNAYGFGGGGGGSGGGYGQASVNVQSGPGGNGSPGIAIIEW